MTESTQVHIVREYLSRLDRHDLDRAQELITDKFVYRPTPQPTALGYGATISKDQYKSFHQTITQNYSDFKTTLEEIDDAPGKVSVRGKTTFKYVEDGEERVAAAPFTTVFSFEGDKISTVDAAGDPNFSCQTARVA